MATEEMRENKRQRTMPCKNIMMTGQRLRSRCIHSRAKQQLMWVVAALFLSAKTLSSASAPLPSGPVLRNLARGSALRCVCDLCGGLPLEVWKSSVVLENINARNPSRKFDGKSNAEFEARPAAGAIPVLRRLLTERGPCGMYSGVSARLIEGSLSGAILLAAKESVHRVLESTPAVTKRVPPALIGFAAGASGGAAQAIVMTPCSLLVTATAQHGGSVSEALRDVWGDHGLRGMYRGAPAVAARQMTNWASRQGFTELVRPWISVPGVGGEILAGCAGGALSAWNTPFEVARIESQSRSFGNKAPSGKHSASGPNDQKKGGHLFETLTDIVKERGVGGLYSGLLPRICQACYQTLFMVCIPRILDA
mmetsp:Transcript_8971/g.26809  ORF Transcript_8971/g.26809 Transcript_8971/m.26809 type:complete len:367 (-) Transcript_8971:46-1146(-)